MTSGDAALISRSGALEPAIVDAVLRAAARAALIVRSTARVSTANASIARKTVGSEATAP